MPLDKSNKNTPVYENYLRVLPFFKDLVYAKKSSISKYWAEEVSGFEYIFDSSPHDPRKPLVSERHDVVGLSRIWVYLEVRYRVKHPGTVEQDLLRS